MSKTKNNRPAIKSVKRLVALLLLIFFLLPNLAYAKKVRRIKLAAIPQAHAEEPVQPVNCKYTSPENPVYSAQFLAVRRKAYVAKKEVFETKVFMQNTGNVPWFSSDSGCAGAIVNLGTEKNRDRSSVFFTNTLFWNSNWLNYSRIKMESKRVDPNGVASFVFWSQAPDNIGLYREYFAPVAEGITWMDGGLFSTDTKVGDLEIDPAKKELLSYIQKSANLADIDLSGDKKIEVDISDQKMWLKIGDYSIREFPVSTGTVRTPTPLGTTEILHKQEVRVAASRPHYIMPKWMHFRKGGYGIHALPSLANDGGVYWREALNHIGTRRSHGCIRLLPNDAEFAFGFADIGTTVEVHN